MADPVYDKDIEEKSLGCVLKRPRFTVSNDLNTPSVRGCWPQKPLPLFPNLPSVKEDLAEKVHKPGLNRVKDSLFPSLSLQTPQVHILLKCPNLNIFLFIFKTNT